MEIGMPLRTCLSELQSGTPKPELLLLDKVVRIALRASLNDPDVASLTLNECRFSIMYDSLCILFDNTEVVDWKAKEVRSRLE